mmetsp:Transcript_105365/g.187333  ORF Transcript_105365/g.187333 Transcript_105365/m.187333 type:complete len:462 (-) Transcript_105365:38-1423(-)
MRLAKSGISTKKPAADTRRRGLQSAVVKEGEVKDEHWQRCRDLIDDYRLQCVQNHSYADALLAEKRLDELRQHELAWRREVISVKFLEERRELGHSFQRENKELVQRWKQGFAAFEVRREELTKDLLERQALEARGRQDEILEDWSRTQLPEPANAAPQTVEEAKDAEGEQAEEEELEHDEIIEVEEGNAEDPTTLEAAAAKDAEPEMEEAEEEIKEDDEIVEVSTRLDSAQDIKGRVTVLPSAELRKASSAWSLELRHKAKKLALLQRYVEASRLQGQAELEEEIIYAAKQEELAQKVANVQERHQFEQQRMEERLCNELSRLEVKKQGEEQLVQSKQNRFHEQLVLRQRKAWQSLGGKAAALEEALRRLARPTASFDAREAKSATRRIAALDGRLSQARSRPGSASQAGTRRPSSAPSAGRSLPAVGRPPSSGMLRSKPSGGAFPIKGTRPPSATPLSL